MFRKLFVTRTSVQETVRNANICSGNYSCVAANTFGRGEASITLTGWFLVPETFRVNTKFVVKFNTKVNT